jgi:hypothetical protein
MEYKKIVKIYDLNSFIGKASGISQANFEVEDWNNILDQYAKDGWVVASGGLIETARDMLLFWALLEREKKMEGTIL